MAVAAHHGKCVLAAKSGNPDIVGGNRSSGFLEFRAKCSVIVGGVLVHVKNAVAGKRICQPFFVSLALAGLTDAIPLLALYDYRNGEFSGAIENRLQCGVAISHR